jgi:hypothetical protein
LQVAGAVPGDAFREIAVGGILIDDELGAGIDDVFGVYVEVVQRCGQSGRGIRCPYDAQAPGFGIFLVELRIAAYCGKKLVEAGV